MSTESKKNLEPCRNCKSEVEQKTRRCPYCGILNPTVKVPEILLTIFAIIIIMSFISYFINN